MRHSITALLVASFWLCNHAAEVQELKPVFFFNGRVYFLSEQPADARSAVKQCEKAGFHLLQISDKSESHNLRRRLMKLEDLESVWSSGEKRLPNISSSPKPEFVWIRGDSSTPLPMTYTDFASPTRLANSRAARDRRFVDFVEYDSNEDKCDKCGCEPLLEDCSEAPNCTITLRECYTKTSACVLIKPNCTANRGECASTCPPCEVTPPQCVATRGPCKVINQECTSLVPECTIKTPDCTTVRPNCTTIQKPCKPERIEVQIPCANQPKCRLNKGPLCSEQKPPCKTYQAPCVSTTAACRNITDSDGIVVDRTCGETTTTCPPPTTTCPPPTTTCRPPIDCTPIYCTSPAIICEKPRVHCPPPQTSCPAPIVNCTVPEYNCPDPIVECPEPVVNCTKPVAVCPGPDIACPGVVTHCTEAQTYCPAPVIICPDPIINCTTPKPCPEVTPRPLVQATCPPDTTQCDATGNCTTRRPKKRSPQQEQIIRPDVDSENFARTECVGLNKEFGFKWDLADCNKPRRFICERVQKDRSMYNDFTMI